MQIQQSRRRDCFKNCLARQLMPKYIHSTLRTEHAAPETLVDGHAFRRCEMLQQPRFYSGASHGSGVQNRAR